MNNQGLCQKELFPGDIASGEARAHSVVVGSRDSRHKNQPPEPRSIDWSLVQGALKRQPVEIPQTPGRMGKLLMLAQELPQDETLLNTALQAMDSLKRETGLERLGLFTCSEDGAWMQGLVGTAEGGTLVDERCFRFPRREAENMLAADFLAGRKAWEYKEDAPLVTHAPDKTSVVRHGWLVRTPLVVKGRFFGLLCNDSAFSRAPYSVEVQEDVAAYLMIVSGLLCDARDRRQEGLREERPVVGEALRLLVADLSISQGTLASRIGMSPRSLARAFSRDLGSSFLEYRNQLRLDRFFELVESLEAQNAKPELSKLASECGFGSYAQFHRVFRARFERSPTEYLSEAAISIDKI